MFYMIVTMAALTFGVVSGGLMLISPARHAAFVRWYTRSKHRAGSAEIDREDEFRLAGGLALVVCVWMMLKLVEKMTGHCVLSCVW